MNSVKNANPIFYKWCDTSLKFPLPLPAIIFRIRRASSHYAQHTLSDMHCRSCIEINVYLYLSMPVYSLFPKFCDIRALAARDGRYTNVIWSKALQTILL